MKVFYFFHEGISKPIYNINESTLLRSTNKFSTVVFPHNISVFDIFYIVV